MPPSSPASWLFPSNRAAIERLEVTQAVPEPAGGRFEARRRHRSVEHPHRVAVASPGGEVAAVDVGPNLLTGGVWGETDLREDVRQYAVWVAHEVLVADDRHPPNLPAVAAHRLVAGHPVMDQRRPGRPADGVARISRTRPLLGGAGDGGWMAQHHHERAIGKQRLQEPHPDQVRRRLL